MCVLPGEARRWGLTSWAKKCWPWPSLSALSSSLCKGVWRWLCPGAREQGTALTSRGHCRERRRAARGPGRKCCVFCGFPGIPTVTRHCVQGLPLCQQAGDLLVPRGSFALASAKVKVPVLQGMSLVSLSPFPCSRRFLPASPLPRPALLWCWRERRW